MCIKRQNLILCKTELFFTLVKKKVKCEKYDLEHRYSPPQYISVSFTLSLVSHTAYCKCIVLSVGH